MRMLNMNELSGLRATTLANMRCIGKGQFASVYGPKTGDGNTVIKVTTDAMSYYLQADGLWLEMREGVERHFPALVTDFGDVGPSCQATAYMLELEWLHPVSNPKHRKLIRHWTACWDSFCAKELTPYASVSRSRTELSRAFCEAQAEVEGPYCKVFEALSEFFSSYGGALDLKLSNFMERPSTGELVFNDVVFDVKDYLRRSRARHNAFAH